MVRSGLTLVLTQVFGPGIDQEHLQIAICDFSVMEDAPLIRAIAADLR